MTDTIERSNEYGERVRLRILEMGLQLWRIDPTYVTARRIAHELGMSHQAVLYHFKHSKGLTDAIAFHAVKQDESRVIVHLIAMKHPTVSHMSDADKLRHMKATV